MRIGLIYQYKNKINGKIYIGQTTLSLDKRHQRHIRSAKSENADDYFHRALRKYGVDNFELTILEDNIPLNNLDEREIFYIKTLDSYYTSNNGYNMTKGGKWSNGSRQIVHGSMEAEIKTLLSETKLSFKEIANKVGLSNIYSISDINRGNSFRDDDITYPIRKTSKPTFISQEEFNILQDRIINTKDSWVKICEECNVNITLLNKINKGKHRLSDPNMEYPLRKVEKQSTYMNKITRQDVIEIIKLLVCEEKKIKDITSKYNIAKNTVGDICRGLTWKEITSKFKCPIIKNRLINKTLFEENYGIV